MSTIPPNWLGSIIQSQGAEKHSAEKKAQEATAETERASGGNFAEKLQNVIDNSDRDGQVYSDAEGHGSQGKPFEESETEDEQERETTDPEESPGGLDLEA